MVWHGVAWCGVVWRGVASVRRLYGVALLFVIRKQYGLIDYLPDSDFTP